MGGPGCPGSAVHTLVTQACGRVGDRCLPRGGLGEGVELCLSPQSKIEDIRLQQEGEAERSIRLHFQMEQIVYCQDQVYRGALQSIREEEAEQQKRKSSSHSVAVSAEEASMAEIFQHLNAYRKVCAGVCVLRASVWWLGGCEGTITAPPLGLG